MSISPDFSTPGLVLAVLLAACVLVGEPLLGKISYDRLARRRDRDPRALIRTLRLWMASSWTLAGLAMVIVAVSPGVGLADVGLAVAGDPGEVAGTVTGMVTVMVVLGLLLWWAGRSGRLPGLRRLTERQSAGFEALLPRTPRERWAGLGMAITAGVCEEVVYRGMLIALGVGVLGLPLKGAAVLALVVFAVGHLYQGWRNVLVVALPGYALTMMYLSTGSLLVPILVHIAIDVRSLALAPAPRPAVRNG
ncbi:CPBP family intramembrane glutamic endopeptidase [Actinomadura hibisca]|uniref:CPBP family intramembrane glutamic endopeptidase n=1 Tax=Actinomadura hibisca TaxID=68565 RepID=UPI00082AAD01|nr:CPBP family intramembrane glutamic endopeptidase [Actinomadura hibisca]